MAFERLLGHGCDPRREGGFAKTRKTYRFDILLKSVRFPLANRLGLSYLTARPIGV